ncbi:MAG: class I SAM-dependent RNA methyltransferase [Microcystaceae cyanobacterium]
MINQYFATVAHGLEEIAAQELENLGAKNINIGFTVIHFQGNQKLLYKVNLWSRLLYRILVPIAEVKCGNGEQLYQEVSRINWDTYLHPNQTLAIRATGKNDKLNHSHYTALTIKNAIVDQQTTKFNCRSDINPKQPDILINAHINNNYCTLSLDSSGDSLHRRGYHTAMGVAPLKETLAAAILDLSDWTPSLPFFDPLCGSGTLPIEAGIKALNIAPGLYRKRFSFENWNDFNPSLWQQLKEEAKQQQLRELPNLIWGSDGESDIIKQAQSNLKSCQLEQQVHLFLSQLQEIKPPTSEGILICNPPYGKRLGNTQELGRMYRLLGDVFKQRFKGWTAYILTGNKALAKQVGLRTSRRIPLYNGSIPCTLLQYKLY